MSSGIGEIGFVVLLAVVGLIVVLVKMDRRSRTRTDSITVINCGHCGESINPGATVCRACRATYHRGPTAPEIKAGALGGAVLGGFLGTGEDGTLIGVIVGAVVGLVLVWLLMAQRERWYQRYNTPG